MSAWRYASCVLSLFFLTGLQAPVLQASPNASEGLPSPFTKRLVAFYGSWSKFQTPPYSAEQIPYHKLTHIIHAGVNLSETPVDGSFDVVHTVGYLEPQLLTRAHAAGVKVLFYVGASNGNDYSVVTASPAFRARFIRDLKNVISSYGYDGLDIDWEYPNGPVDFKNFVTFMNEIRAAFPSHAAFILSTDIPNFPSSGVDFANLKKVVDWFNIMMYDAAGPWVDEVQMNSPIFTDPGNPDFQGSAEQAIHDFTITYGVPAEQLNMGTPFYGYEYMNQKALYQPCDNCTDDNVPSLNYGTQIKPLINQSGWIKQWDSVEEVPYLVRADGSNGFITYDDPVSTFIRVYYSLWDHDLGGSFMWELSADYDGKSQDLLQAMYLATLGHGISLF